MFAQYGNYRALSQIIKVDVKVAFCAASREVFGLGLQSGVIRKVFGRRKSGGVTREGREQGVNNLNFEGQMTSSPIDNSRPLPPPAFYNPNTFIPLLPPPVTPPAHHIRTVTPPSSCPSSEEVTGTLLECAVHHPFILLRSAVKTRMYSVLNKSPFSTDGGKRRYGSTFIALQLPQHAAPSIPLNSFTTHSTHIPNQDHGLRAISWVHVMGLPGTKAGSFEEAAWVGRSGLRTLRAHIRGFRTDL
ncbi:hypothetical protein V8E53_012249 [Lactarius tabidus]